MQRETVTAGPLRNGNQRGDPNLAPRCGARTRAGCACQSPAMANGRCRMHGGASTGARTADGRTKIQAARTVHGLYGDGAQAAFRRQGAMMGELRRALRALDSGDVEGALAALSPRAEGS